MGDFNKPMGALTLFEVGLVYLEIKVCSILSEKYFTKDLD